MAITQGDWMREGEQAALDGRPCVVPPLSTGWEQKAWTAGWKAGQRQLAESRKEIDQDRVEKFEVALRELMRLHSVKGLSGTGCIDIEDLNVQLDNGHSQTVPEIQL